MCVLCSVSGALGLDTSDDKRGDKRKKHSSVRVPREVEFFRGKGKSINTRLQAKSLFRLGK